MVTNAKNVLVGSPDQATTGAILSAPSGTALPATAVAVPGVPFKDSGYINEEGLTLTPSRSTADIKDWSGAIVRTVLEEFKGTLAWAHLEVNEESLKTAFGDANVTVTAATVSSGKQIKVAIGAKEMPRKAWVFRIKDGTNRVMITVPDGQVTETGDITFVTNGAITLPIVLSTYPDASGNSIYIHTDDGVFSA